MSHDTFAGTPRDTVAGGGGGGASGGKADKKRQKTFTQYTLRCATVDGRSWQVHKRYSEFQKLRATLGSTGGDGERLACCTPAAAPRSLLWWCAVATAWLLLMRSGEAARLPVQDDPAQGECKGAAHLRPSNIAAGNRCRSSFPLRSSSASCSLAVNFFAIHLLLPSSGLL